MLEDSPLIVVGCFLQPVSCVEWCVVAGRRLLLRFRANAASRGRTSAIPLNYARAAASLCLPAAKEQDAKRMGRDKKATEVVGMEIDDSCEAGARLRPSP